MQRILELALKSCESAEVYSNETASAPVEFENNRLKSVETREQRTVALRVIKDGRLGFSSTTKADDAAGLVSRACETAEFGAQATFAFPGDARFSPVDNYDPELERVALSALMQTGESIIDELASLGPGALASVNLSKATQRLRVMNSAGLDASHISTHYGVFAAVEMMENQSLLQVYDGMSGSKATLDTEQMLSRVRRKVKHGRKDVGLSSGKYPVLLTPLAVGDLIRPIIACVNGTAVEKGYSPWKSAIGSKVADSRFSLYDDPTRPESAYSRPFDDEGIPASKLSIVRHGVLENFMLNLKSAKALGTKPTGNARRPSASSPPGIGNSTLVVDPGQTPLAELLQTVRHGVVVDTLMGAWSANPYGGAVNGNIMLGFLVRDGEIVGRVKNAMFSANVFEALKDRTVGLSSERIDYGSSLFPYVLLDSIAVQTSSGGVE